MKTMKIIILVVALVIMITMALQAQSQNNQEVTKLIDAVMVEAKATGLNSPKVIWDSLREDIDETSRDAKSVYDLKKSFEHLLVALNDKHGMFYDPTTNTCIASYPKPHSTEIPELKIDQPKFHYEVLDHNVRYIRVVAVPFGGDAKQQAQQFRDAVDSLMKGADSLKWVVDLRYASGGDMKPIFSGFAPLLDEGLVATTVDNKGKIQNMYTVHNGNFYVNQVRVGKFSLHTTDLRNAKVAVLTSRYTSGAAEIFSIALKGKKHTRFFGEPTAGDIFDKTTISISKSVAMQIASTMYVNRKGIEYKHELTPDTLVEFVPNTDIKHDKAIAEAILWLTTAPVTESATKVASN